VLKCALSDAALVAADEGCAANGPGQLDMAATVASDEAVSRLPTSCTRTHGTGRAGAL